MTEAKVEFAGRLNQAFDRLGIPAKQHGRFTAIARLFGVSAVAARDWCEGKSYPSVDKLLVIMDTVRCGADWLLFGRDAAGPAAAPPGAEAAALPTPQPALEDWIRVGSDAMAPSLLPGDSVRLAPVAGRALEDGLHLVAAAGMEGSAGARLRRLLRRLDGTVEIGCDNPLYAERAAYREVGAGRLEGSVPGAPDLRVLGRVAEIRRVLP